MVAATLQIDESTSAALEAPSRADHVARYFFHLVRAGDVIPDRVGVELADASRAYRISRAVAEELRASEAGRELRWEGWQIVIVESQGQAVAVLPL